MFKKSLFITAAALLTLITVTLSSGAVPDAQAARSKRAAKYTWQIKGKANINNATVTKLRCLPGIGAAKARSIVTHRRKKPFTSLAQLRSIRGIGKKLFARIRPYISLSGETTITRKRVRRR